MKQGARASQFVLKNPVPFISILGLGAGLVLLLARDSPAAQLVWLITLAVGGAPLVLQTVRGMLRGNFAQDVVAMLAVITAVLTREYFAGVVIVIMQGGGEALEAYSLARASSSLDALLARAPRVAFRRNEDSLEQISVEAVKVGDLLVVRPGDLIPVDGTLTSDDAEVDESALTGEPLTPSKHAGSRLLSGSVNLGESFDMRADKLSGESQYSKIVQLVRKAQEERPPIQRLADRYAVWFTPLTLAMCVLGWLYTRSFDTVLAVLVVATPCPLILAVPVAVISAINRAASEGIIVKGGTAIEQIGSAKVVVFDKTGTLTTGHPDLAEIVPLNGVGEEELLFLAGSAEQLSSHALAQTTASAALDRLGRLAAPENFREQAGRGVECSVEGKQLLVGSRRLLEERLRLPISPSDGNGALEAFISVDGQVAGLLRFQDTIRDGAKRMIQRLKEMGVRQIVMLTGDSEGNASRVALGLGIERFEANLLPEEKVRIVEQLQGPGEVTVMVGDGINDAPALATATVGVAMGAHGTGISAEAADIVLLVDDIGEVADAIAIGRRMLRIAKQSILVGIGVSFCLMVAAVLGKIAPVNGALLQEALDVGVILNALRARRA